MFLATSKEGGLKQAPFSHAICRRHHSLLRTHPQRPGNVVPDGAKGMPHNPCMAYLANLLTNEMVIIGMLLVCMNLWSVWELEVARQELVVTILVREVNKNLKAGIQISTYI